MKIKNTLIATTLISGLLAGCNLLESETTDVVTTSTNKCKCKGDFETCDECKVDIDGLPQE
ncbi:hypothetical protein [Candidatus Liberibacter americanus]|uniref:Membrane lipoprotein n=1 Tax=Candidatus Liberibacter americanus str. Sao Paulo TaxID=1261131 RepID=U6B4L3_9HYPH|nr:hypothetical protein [Candidatus Liberibacter americanus]AHA28009.1 hypothetical protein lam_663 [Candidatus Liberibacter americanus str. Sao Paulo]EMS35794.1 hypothetical protein G653_04816 [Candidatus Liberibacter americanus PW_SP]